MRFQLAILSLLFSSFTCYADCHESFEDGNEPSCSDTMPEKRPSKRPLLDVKVYIPLFNSFYKMESTKHDLGAGTLGLGLNTDFHLNDQSILSITLNSALNRTEIIWIPMELGSGTDERYLSAYFGISRLHQIKRLQLGYGLSVSRNRWTSRKLDLGIPISTVDHFYSDMGFLFPINYQIGKRFFVGVEYRPSIVQLSPRFNIKYEHLIEMCIGWKFSLMCI
jgi:hypothetical protein